MNIRVNHSDLRAVARVIEDYCSIQDREMNRADTAIITMLATSWHGLDADAFQKQWAGVNDRDSIAFNLMESLTNYAGALSASADIYMRTQVDVVNAAGILMRLMG